MSSRQLSYLGSLGAIVALTLTASAEASANAPSGRYTFAPTGATVLDSKTKLTWQRGTAPSANWTDAKAYCGGVGATLGGSGWRLPSVKELQTLVDYSQAAGIAIDLTAFPSTSATDYWTSTVQVGVSSVAWVVGFSDGFPDQFGTSTILSVRCVR